MISRDDNQELVRLRNENQALVSTLAAIKYGKRFKTLRDEFAMAIINGMVSRCDSDGKCNDLSLEDLEYAFVLADLAMKAREVKS